MPNNRSNARSRNGGGGRQQQQAAPQAPTNNGGGAFGGFTTTQEEIEAAAKKAGVFTGPMIAAELGLSEGAVRNRIRSRKIEPSAKIHPKSRGRFSWAYNKEALDKIAEEVSGEVEVEMLSGGGR